MDRLDVIEQIITCTACELCRQCTTPVPMRGEPGLVAVIGEAPGETEDHDGEPFVGPAGKLIQELLDEHQFPPVGFLNSASCFPHGTPTWDHLHACEANKWAQVDYFGSTYLLLLGRVALKGMRSDLDLKRGRARPFKVRDRICFASYHPAAALRHQPYEESLRADLEAFRVLVDAGPDKWTDFIPQSCAACPNPAEWFETDAGLGWCPIHLPSSEEPAYQSRQALLAAEMDAARRRSRAARDAGIAQVEANADADWMREAWDALVEWLQTHDEFFSDDWWAGTGMPEPREARALGPLVMRAAREGLMQKTGEFRKSVRSNMTEKPCWRSLIRLGAAR